MKTSVTARDAGDIKIIELHGKITIGAGDLQMREGIHAALAAGAKKIVIDMKDVTTIDSSGVGELVGCYTTATHRGAKLKLMSLPP
ncbi:MAG TPA: STAS domain-containing protein, partial [Thermoanaerobaculia bacterium]|nr:STAS domain-containing protein [Thermoanaerobaculia bacterium]